MIIIVIAIIIIIVLAIARYRWNHSDSTVIDGVTYYIDGNGDYHK